MPVSPADETKVFIECQGETVSKPKLDPSTISIKLSPENADGHHSKRKDGATEKLVYSIGISLLLIGIAVVILTLVILLPDKRFSEEQNSEKSLYRGNLTTKYTLPENSTIHHFSDLDTSCSSASCDIFLRKTLSWLNTSVDPCDNFYNFACQGWLAQNPRPDYTNQLNVFRMLDKQSIHVVIDILNMPEETVDLPVLATAKRYYQTCLNSRHYMGYQNKSMESQDMQYILDKLEAYGGWPILYKNGTWNNKRFDWMKTIAGLKKEFDHTELLKVILFQSSGIDLLESLVIFDKPGFGSSSLDVSTDDFVIKDFIVNVTRDMLIFSIGKCIDCTNYLEKAAWEIIWFRRELVELLNEARNNRQSGSDESDIYTVENLQEFLDDHMYQVDIPKLLSAFYANTSVTIETAQSVAVPDFDYLTKLISLVSKIEEETLANYLHFKMVYEMIHFSGIKKFLEYASTLRNVVRGTTSDTPTNIICAHQVQQKFPFVMGHAYLKQLDLWKAERQASTNSSDIGENAAENFDKVQELFENIRSEIVGLTNSTTKDYINASTVSEILDFVRFCPGYPSWILETSRVQSEYDEITFSEDYQHSKSFLEQSIEINKWTANKQLLEFVEYQECKWTGFLGTPEALTQLYVVYVSKALLGLPYFDPLLSSSLNYGRLGSIIGHEIAHNLHGWSKYENGTNTPIAECLIEQFNSYGFGNTEDTDLNVDGIRTLKENLADNAGLLAAYNAYKANSHLDNDTYQISGLVKYTGDQLFYIGFAQNWCETGTEEHFRESLINDVHSPGQFRILGTLHNSPEFADAWNCPVGSNMNPKRDKCVVF